MADPLFRAFYRQARAHFQPRQFGLVKARTGFRRRVVRLEGGLVVLKHARRSGATRPGTAAYALTGCIRAASFIYYQLTPDDFLFVLVSRCHRRARRSSTRGSPEYRPYRNSFGAALATARDSEEGSADPVETRTRTAGGHS